MTDQANLTRRSFLGMVGALAAAGAAVAAGPGLAEAAVGRSVVPVRSGAGAAGSPAVDTVGYRAAVGTRLSLLERHGGLEALPQGELGFRPWARQRLERLEELRGLEPPPREEVYRDWAIVRVEALEEFLPQALRNPAYTHMPIGLDPAEHARVLRERISAGVCDGVFLYRGAGSPLDVDDFIVRIVESGPPIPIIMSPKDVSDAGKLAAWMDYWAARPAWIPYVRVAYWQEPQGDFGGEHTPISVWHDNVNTLADAADRVGIVSLAHVETWHLHPDYDPDGGPERLMEFITPVLHRLGGISWSVFVFNEKDGAANNFVRWMDEFMAANYPWTSYGIGAYGDSVPKGIAADDPRRIARAARVRSTLDQVRATDETNQIGFYALPQGPVPTRDFWDPLVEAVVAAWLADR